jgi:hypothetical protein
VDVRFGARVESEAADLQVQTAPGEAKGTGRFRDVAASTVEGGLYQVAFHLLDGVREVG